MIKHVTVVQNRSTDPDSARYQRVQAFFKAHGVQVTHLAVEGKDCPDVPPDATSPDVVIVLGGDGTFLRAARRFVSHQVPLVGINTGALGFLVHIHPDRMEEYLGLLVAGKYTLDPRMMLSIKDAGKHGTCRIDCNEGLALNDVVVKNANPSQLCTLSLYVNDTLVATYDADGLILSTPSGTTAYTMAAGGPVVSPEVDAIAITPICPHSLSAKPVVAPFNKEFRIESADARNGEVVYALDGLECGVIRPGESITVARAPIPFKMVNFQRDEDDFYDLLKRKLQWSLNPRAHPPVQ